MRKEISDACKCQNNDVILQNAVADHILSSLLKVAIAKIATGGVLKKKLFLKISQVY